MVERVRIVVRDRWRLLILISVIVVLAVATLVLSSPLAGAVSVLVTGGLGLFYNRASHSPPRPEVGLIAIGTSPLNPSELVAEIFETAAADGKQEPSTAKLRSEEITAGRRRSLDVEAVVADGVHHAYRQAPGKGPLASLTTAISSHIWAKPTEQDFEEFDADVDDYQERLRRWVVEVDDYLTERCTVLLLQTRLENPAKLDAENARVAIVFPPAFGPPEKLPESPKPPAPPTFPYRPSPLQRMMGQTARPGHSSVPIVSPVDPPRARSKLRSPRYELLPDGGLEVDYPRQTIHHGESGTAGEPLIVAVSKPGEHRVSWEVHAKNLPTARRGHVTIGSVGSEICGEPIKTLGDLQAVLEDLALP